jgi:hypothetical protein
MRGFRSTLVLLVVFGAMLAYIYFIENRKPAAGGEPPKAKAVTVVADKIAELSVKPAAGDRIVLRKVDNIWQEVEPTAVAADPAEVSGITNGLAGLEIQRVVDENPKDLKQYGLAQPRVDVGFTSAGDKAMRHLFIGDKTATGSDLYAKLQDDKKVFLISGYLDTTFNRTAFDLRDKTILKFDRNQADSVQVVTSDRTIEMAKTGEEWKISKPVEARGDYGSIEGLIGRMQSTQMKSVVTPEAKDLKEYGLDKPDVKMTVGTGSARATLELGKKSPDGTIYAKDSARPVIFTVEASLAGELKKPADDYRRKDLFEFRAFNTTSIEITRGKDTLAFEKTTEQPKDKGKEPETHWRQVKPTAHDADLAKVEDFLSKLSNLRAQSFADAKTKTGLDAPVATVSVKFDDGKKQERVVFGKIGADVYASRSNEAGVAKIDATEFDDVMKALDAIK